jgi:hypothetical protein
MEEYRLDVVGFAVEILGVELHPGQIRILEVAFPRGVEPEDWPFKFIHIATGNRFGKSVILAILHLWFGTYKHRCGFAYGTGDWFDTQYSIINLCPLNDIAYVVREKVGLILMDKADEQIKRLGGRGHVSPALISVWRQARRGDIDKSGNPFLISIPDTEYKGYVSKHHVYLEYRTADDHAKATQGRKKYLVTFDEAGRHKDPLNLIGSDIAPRTIDSRGVIVTATTPHLESESNYEEVWQKGNPDNPDKGKYTMSFLGSMDENPYVTRQMRDESLEDQPDYLWPQVIEGKFIQSSEAFFNSAKVTSAMANIPNLRRRISGHTYILGWDLAVAKDGDRTIGIVVDVTSNPCRVVEYLELARGTQHPEIVNEMVKQLHWYHNEKSGTNAFLVYDETGMAGKMFKAELATVYPRPRGYDFTNKIRKKLDILHSLRILLAKNMIVFPKDCTRLAFELKHYTRKDQHLETDAVMAFALATYMVERTTGRLTGDAIIQGSLTI